MSSRKDEAGEWTRSVIGNHLSRTARRYSLAMYVGEASVSTTLGIRFDLRPVEGKVVAQSDEWILVKIGRAAEFFVAARDFVDVVPELGAVVRITPYARRGFDGRRLDAPREELCGNGVRISSFTLGENRSVLPIDKDALKSKHLRDMIVQVEELSAHDGMRCLSQVLVDAGACLAPVEYVDPDDSHIIATPPALKFWVHTAKHDGWIEIRYDRATDTYTVVLTGPDGGLVVDEEGVYFDSLAEVVVDLIDDGRWRIATVEILKPAPRRALAA
ncbi:MAG: hypothetical protein IPI02_21360 [Sterolibacteriaceae bacterium]|nr:hypothetical protein [Sterolibacteriaceae bacterium]